MITPGTKLSAENGWIEWTGGENPVPGKRVDVRQKGGSVYLDDPSDGYFWQHGFAGGDIIAYRVVSDPVVPGCEDQGSSPQEAIPAVDDGQTIDLFGTDTDPESMNLGPSLARAMRLSIERIERVQSEFQPTHTVLTVSGGRDSAAEVEFALEMGIRADLILHGRTGTGIRQTTEHVIDHYGNLGPDLIIADAGEAYEEYVMRKGFFGIGKEAHNFSYHVLKATPFRKAISKHIRQGKREVRVLLLNGARMTESDNRRINLPETKRDPASPGNLWVNLIHDWTDGDRDRYLRLRQTRINPVAVQLCRSGECMCGTQQSLQSRAEAANLYPEWGNWIDDLERRAVAKHGWGWGVPMPRPADPNQVEMFTPMCMGCAREAAVRGEAVAA